MIERKEPDPTIDDASVEPGARDEAAHLARRRRVETLKQELVGGELLTAAEVADILDIHPRTVSEYVRDGKLHAFQFGGGWKISENALRAFVRGQTASPAAQAAEQGAPVLRAVSDVLAALLPHAGAKRRTSPFRCSFCGKGQEQVRRLIAGPGHIYICDACVGLCNEIIATETTGAGQAT